MQGKTVVITGATSGIGQCAAVELARAGARMVFTARSPAKGADMLERLRAANSAVSPALVVGDLSTIAGMKAVAEKIAIEAGAIDGLINNAGAFFDRRDETTDGFERTFALNHMAYFVVTEMLRPSLAQDARIVSTSSSGHSFGRLNLADLQAKRGYQGGLAYANSKLCNVLWTRELARRLLGTGVTANCVHPGVVSTAFGQGSSGIMGAFLVIARPFMLTPVKGADTIVYLASSMKVAGESGGYWIKRKRVEPSAAARDEAAGRKLWEESARLAGLPVN